MLMKWGEMCQYKRSLYEKAVDICTARDRWFGVPMVILGCVTTSSLFFQADCDSDVPYQTIVTGTLSMTLTILTAIGNLIGVKQDAIEFAHVKTEYNRIILSIEEQLTRLPSQRANCIDFVSRIKSDILKLDQGSKLPASIYRKYVNDIDTHMKAVGIEMYHSPMARSPAHIRDDTILDADFFVDMTDRRKSYVAATPDSKVRRIALQSQRPVYQTALDEEPAVFTKPPVE